MLFNYFHIGSGSKYSCFRILRTINKTINEKYKILQENNPIYMSYKINIIHYAK